ncbi:hypothetical protein ACX1C1_09935 [Paenibacillus sp. strain BS8-2]
MTLVITVVVLAVALAWYEISRLRKRKWIRESWAFSVFLLCGVVLCVLYLLQVPIPSPIKWIKMMFTPVSDAINRLLGLK